jgi:hypothetical protein
MQSKVLSTKTFDGYAEAYVIGRMGPGVGFFISPWALPYTENGRDWSGWPLSRPGRFPVRVTYQPKGGGAIKTLLLDRARPVYPEPFDWVQFEAPHNHSTPSNNPLVLRSPPDDRWQVVVFESRDELLGQPEGEEYCTMLLLAIQPLVATPTLTPFNGEGVVEPYVIEVTDRMDWLQYRCNNTTAAAATLGIWSYNLTLGEVVGGWTLEERLSLADSEGAGPWVFQREVKQAGWYALEASASGIIVEVSARIRL